MLEAESFGGHGSGRDERQPNLSSIYLFVRDLGEALAFYQRLGLTIERISDMLARATMANGVTIEFGTAALTQSYDPTWQPPTGSSTNTIGFEFPSRAAVDAMYEALIRAGYRGHLAPCDPPWGARFALVDDPDRNVIALHSPRDRTMERKRERAGAS